MIRMDYILFHFLNHVTNKVVMYEQDKRYIKGGVIDNHKLLGINKKNLYK